MLKVFRVYQRFLNLHLGLPCSLTYSKFFFLIGREALHEAGVQVSRHVRVLRRQIHLAQAPLISRGRKPPQRAIRRGRQSDARQRRPRVHPRGSHHQAPRERRHRVHGRVPHLLRPGQEDRLAGHPWPSLQPHFYRGGRMRTSVLRQGVRGRAQDPPGELQLQVPVLLRGAVRDLRQAAHLQQVPVVQRSKKT